MKTPTLTRSLLAIVLATLTASLPAFAGTKTLNSGATTLDTAGNWTPSGIPITTDEALIDATNSQSALTLSTSQTFGDLLINNSSLASMSLTGATSRTITLSGGGGSTAATAAGGVAGDLLLLGTNVVSSVRRRQ